MKKVLLVLFITLICATILFFFINERSFSPLGESDIKMLFPEQNIDIEKECSVDFLGFNSKGELHEFYMYRLSNVSIDRSYPKFNGEWEKHKISNYDTVSKWKPCPIDSVDNDLFKFVFTTKDFNKKECSSTFYNELKKDGNYYSFFYFNELEKYFLLYCPDSNTLYYVRQKGF